MEPIYRIEYRVRSVDVDPWRRMRLSALFSLLQEGATDHAGILGVASGQEGVGRSLWVVTGQQAQIRRMPLYQDRLVLTTWPGVPDHVFFPRFYRLEDQEGEVLVQASALWVLMDPDSRKMRLAGPEIGLTGVVTGEECPLPQSPKMGQFTGEGAFTVPQSYTDLNGHMNNARYFDLAEDNLPQDLLRRTPRQVTVRYGREALPGSTLELRMGREGESWFFSGEREGKRVFRLRLDYSEQ